MLVEIYISDRCDGKCFSIPAHCLLFLLAANSSGLVLSIASRQKMMLCATQRNSETLTCWLQILPECSFLFVNCCGNSAYAFPYAIVSAFVLIEAIANNRPLCHLLYSVALPCSHNLTRCIQSLH